MFSKTHIQNRQQERVLKRLQEKSNKQVSHFIQRLKNYDSKLQLVSGNLQKIKITFAKLP